MNTLDNIKLRCWSIQEERFIENFVIMDGGLWLINDESEMNLANPDDYIISRFTGETYMGQDIYEGDIISSNNVLRPGERLERFVRFDHGFFGLVPISSPLVKWKIRIGDVTGFNNDTRIERDTIYEREIQIN